MLKYIIQALADAEERFRDLYKETDMGGKKVFVLQVDGAVPKEKLDEFRDSNRTMDTELKAFKAIGLSPDELVELKTNRDDLKADKLIKKGDVDAVRKEVATLKDKEFAEEREKYTKENAALQKRLSDVLIVRDSQAAAAKLGVVPEALEMVALKVAQVFSIQDGVAVAKGPDGKELYAKDGFTKLTIDDWMKGYVETNAYLLPPNGGSGSQGTKSGTGAGASSGSEQNPFKEGSINKTRQVQLKHNDRAKYDRYRAEAGLPPDPAKT